MILFLQRLIRQVDDCLLDIIQDAHDVFSRRGGYNSNGGGYVPDNSDRNMMVTVIGDVVSKTKPPIDAKSILFLLSSFGDWPTPGELSQLPPEQSKQFKLAHLSALEPLARDAIGHSETRVGDVLQAMLLFTEQMESQARREEEEQQQVEDEALLEARERKMNPERQGSSSNNKTSLAALKQRRREQQMNAAGTHSAENESDTLLITILSERLVPTHVPVLARILPAKYLLPLARFLVAAQQMHQRQQRADNNAVSVHQFEQLLLFNHAARRLPLLELNELAVIFIVKLRGPLDGSFVEELLERWREAPDAMPGLEAIAVAARMGKIALGEERFVASDLAEAWSRKATRLVAEM